MSKKASMAGYADSSFSETNSITILEELLESKKRIKTHFGEGDKVPNHDGYFELLRNEPEKRPKRRFNVQIKSVKKLDKTESGKNEGKYLYKLKTEFLYYVQGMISKDPAIYFVVDITTRNVFFIYLSEEKLKDINFEGKQNVRYKFTDEDIIKDIDLFTELLESISEEYNQNIESYGKVYSRAIQKLRTYMTEEQAKLIISEHIQNDNLISLLPDDNHFSLVFGEYGLGKSFNAEILYFKLLEEYQKNLNACIYYPVWIKSTTENIEELVFELENAHSEKEIVAFYDELEQCDINKIERKLIQFSNIAKGYKQIRLIVISRPINIKDEIIKYTCIKKIELLSISQVVHLFEVISGDIQMIDIQKVEPSIQNIICRPLFALLLINNKKIQKEIHNINASKIKKYLFKDFFDRIFDTRETIKRDFIRIATALMKSDSNYVDFDTISIDSNKNEIIRQGLVYVDDNNNLRFFIDSFKEWLSAEGIFQKAETFNNILINVNTLYKWKYVIVQLIERYGTDSFKFVLQVIKKYPAFIGILNKEWIPKIDITATYDSTELANFDSLFTCIKESFPVLFENVTYTYNKYSGGLTFTFNKRNMVYTFFGSSRDDVFWYYDVIHKILCYYITDFCAERENIISDELKNTAIYKEKIWKLACNKISCGELHNQPIIINDDEIKPPWDFMELIDEKKPNCYWNNTKDSILKRTKQILKLAISDYKLFIDTLFPNMSNMLYHYQMLPFALKCELYYRRRPCIKYFIECLEKFKYSNVEIKWNETKSDDNIFLDNELKEMYDLIVHYRTESSELLYPIKRSAVLEIWKFMPVFDKMLEWFDNDLKKLYLKK